MAGGERPRRLRSLAREVEQLQAARPEPAPDAEVGRWTRRFRAARERWEWLDHLVIAASRYDRRNGDSYAAGLTFQTFVAIVPILLLAVSVFGFVMRSNIEWAQSLFERVAAEVPGGGGDLLADAMQAAFDQAGTVGVLSLLLVGWLGTSWVSNMRVAIQRMWGRAASAQGNWFVDKAIDLGVLVGLGVAALISLALSAIAGDVTKHLVRALGIEHVTGAGVLLKVVAIAAGMGADIVILQYLMVSLARERVSRRAVLRGALLGAAGLELLKLLGTLFLGRMLQASPAAGVFGTVVILLVWLNLICRWLMLVVCWTASSRPVLEQQLARHRRDGLVLPGSAGSEGSASAVVPASGAVAAGPGDPDRDTEQEAEDGQERPVAHA